MDTPTEKNPAGVKAPGRQVNVELLFKISGEQQYLIVELQGQLQQAMRQIQDQAARIKELMKTAE